MQERNTRCSVFFIFKKELNLTFVFIIKRNNYWKPYMNKIYLDVCSLCRPFDNQDYARISLETDAVNLILTGVRANKYQLMKSPVHLKEITAIADEFEKKELLRLLEDYGNESRMEFSAIKERTEELIFKRFGIADAAHIAFSEYYGSIFISCDDKLLGKCGRSDIKILCINPVTFCEMENLK